MKRFMAIFLCTALLLLSVPGLAQAESQAKTDFIKNYTTILQKSFETQSTVYKNIKNNTITLKVSGKLTDSQLITKNGMNISNYPGSFEINLVGNLSAKKVNCSFKGVLGENELNGQFYITDQGLITTRETIESLHAIGADEDLIDADEIDNLPEYIIFPIEDEDAAAFNEAILQSMEFGMTKSDDLVAIYKEILMTLPDSCYSYSQGDPVLSLDLNTLMSDEFINNLKNNSDSIIDKFISFSSLGEEIGKDSAQEMKDSIKELTPEMVKDVLKDIPITINKFEIICKSDQIEENLDIGYKENDDSASIICESDSQVGAADSSANLDMQIKIDVDDTDLDSDIKMDITSDPTKMICSFVLTANGQVEENTVKGKAAIDLTCDWSSRTPVTTPALTPENSKVIEPKVEDYPSDEGISLYVDGEYMNFDDASPIVVNGRTMVPLRELAEYLGCDVEWQAPSTIKISGYKGTVTMTVDSTKYLEGSVEKQMDVAPFIKSGHTYVPVRFIGEYFDYEVEWDPEYQCVDLYSY
ncbi:MAG: copper amine oxidase N-terminal domain-containing protein [Deltaproteobacteria bacterium]